MDGATGATRTEAAAGNEVDIRKTISSPALQQMLSLSSLSSLSPRSNHRGAPSPSRVAASSAGGFGAGATLLGGGGGGGGGAVAVPPATPASMHSG